VVQKHLLFDEEPLHAIPKSELIHTSINFLPDAVPAALQSPPPPSPSPPGAPPPRGPQAWVVESRLPPRPVASKAYNESVDAFLVQDARPGTVLVGGKGFQGAYSFLNGAVVLLLSVCHCQPSIYGVVLNSMTQETMGSVFCPNAASRYPNFVNSTVRSGGPNAPHWTVLSTSASSGAREVERGLFAGGSLLDLNRQVSMGKASVASVGFYSGYVAWRISDLRKQVANGQWLVAKAPASLLLKSARESAGKKLVTSITAALK